MLIRTVFALTSVIAGPTEPCDATLEGRVVDLATGAGISQVVVHTNETPPRQVETDDTGGFQLDAVCRGRIGLRVERADYDPVNRAVSVQQAHVEISVSLEPTPVDRIDDVIVEAPAIEPTQMHSYASLDGEALARTRGRNLADALAQVPGVTVLRGPAGGLGKPIIRGQFGRRNLLIHNGIRLQTQTWGIDHAPEIDPFSAERITIIKGGASLRYGSDAVGGVVLIDPPPLPTTDGVTGEVHVVGVSNGLQGTFAARVQGKHRLTRGWVWRAEGNVSRGAGRRAPDYPLDNTGSLVWNAGGVVGYVHPSFGIELDAHHHAEQAGLCTCQVIDSYESFQQTLTTGIPFRVDTYRSDYPIDRPYQAVQHTTALGRAHVQLLRWGTLTATYAYQLNDRREYDYIQFNITTPQLAFDLQTHTAELVLERSPLAITAQVGLEGEEGISFGRQINRLIAQYPLIPDHEHTTVGAFAVERLTTDRVDLEVSGRYDGLWRQATLTPSLFNAQLSSGTLVESACSSIDDERWSCDERRHTGSGSIATVIRPVLATPEFTLRFDLGSAARFPGIDEQYINGTAPSFPVKALGNATAGTERTWSATTTVGFANAWLATEGSVYTNYVDNYIYFAPLLDVNGGLVIDIKGTTPLFGFQPIDAWFFGGEFGARVVPPIRPRRGRWNDPLELSAQAAWVRGQSTSGTPLVFVPADQYAVSLTVRTPDVWRFQAGRFGLTGTFVDRKRQFDPDADLAPPPSGYALLGAHASVDLVFTSQVLTFALEGRNLTNTRYRDYTSLLRYFTDEPGWELLARVSLQFGVPTVKR